MKKSSAVRLAGSPAKLARLLSISPQAVSKWKETVPALQTYRLRELKPQWFKTRKTKEQAK